MKKYIPKKCKSCKLLWTGGIKDDIHNKWCGKFSNACWKIIGHCELNNGYEPKEER